MPPAQHPVLYRMTSAGSTAWIARELHCLWHPCPVCAQWFHHVGITLWHHTLAPHVGITRWHHTRRIMPPFPLQVRNPNQCSGQHKPGTLTHTLSLSSSTYSLPLLHVRLEPLRFCIPFDSMLRVCGERAFGQHRPLFFVSPVHRATAASSATTCSQSWLPSQIRPSCPRQQHDVTLRGGCDTATLVFVFLLIII